MIIHGSNATTKKRVRVDITDERNAIRLNTASSSTTDNVIATPTKKVIANPYRFSSISKSNTVTPSNTTTFGQVHNPYYKNKLNSLSSSDKAAVLVSQDSETNYTTPNRKQITPIHNPYSRKNNYSHESRTALVSSLQSRIINSSPVMNLELESNSFGSSLFSIASSDDSAAEYSSMNKGSENNNDNQDNDDMYDMDDGHIPVNNPNDLTNIITEESSGDRNLYNFKVSPFGCYCSICKVPVGKDGVFLNTLRSHNQRNKKKDNNMHPKLSMQNWVTLVGVLKVQLHEMKSKKALQNYMTKTYTYGYICTKCDTVLVNIRSRNQHIKVKKNSNNRQLNNHQCTEVDCVMVKLQKTTCGRWVGEMITNDEAVELKLNESSRMELTVESAKNLLAPYERIDEDIDAYLPIVLKWMIECEDKNKTVTRKESVIDFIVNDYNRITSGNKSKELILFLQYSKQWLFEKATTCVKSIGGNYRVKLQSFDVKEMDDGGSIHQCFNIRKNLDALWSELELQLMYFWYHISLR